MSGIKNCCLWSELHSETVMLPHALLYHIFLINWLNQRDTCKNATFYPSLIR